MANATVYVKAIFTRDPVCRTEPNGCSGPPVSSNATRIHAQLEAVMDMVVNQGQQGGCWNPNGMQVLR